MSVRCRTDLRAAQVHGRVRLLDVACGSGRFPTALLAAGLEEALPQTVVATDLLDPSPFSIAEARAALAPPFAADAELPIGIESLPPPDEPYDVAWATHALYAVPPELLDEGLARMHRAIRVGGLGVVAQATAASHYLRAYEAYRASHAPRATPYTTAEQVTAGLNRAGARPRVQVLDYTTRSSDPDVVEGYLQRCAFDDSLRLADMTAPGPHGTELARYLATCRSGDTWTFTHQIHLITWQPEAAGQPRAE